MKEGAVGTHNRNHADICMINTDISYVHQMYRMFYFSPLICGMCHVDMTEWFILRAHCFFITWAGEMLQKQNKLSYRWNVDRMIVLTNVRRMHNTIDEAHKHLFRMLVIRSYFGKSTHETLSCHSGCLAGDLLVHMYVYAMSDKYANIYHHVPVIININGVSAAIFYAADCSNINCTSCSSMCQKWVQIFLFCCYHSSLSWLSL